MAGKSGSSPEEIIPVVEILEAHMTGLRRNSPVSREVSNGEKGAITCPASGKKINRFPSLAMHAFSDCTGPTI